MADTEGTQPTSSGSQAAVQMEDLIKVKKLFERHEGSVLTEHHFVQGMKEIFDYMHESLLTWWFTHINVDHAPVVSWHQFVQHLMEGSVDGGAAGIEKQFTLLPEQHGMATGPKRKVGQANRILCPAHGPLITTHEEGEIHLWSAKDYTYQWSLQQPSVSSISDACLMRDDGLLTVSTYDRVITIYNCNNWHPIRRFVGARKWSDLPPRLLQTQTGEKTGELEVLECLLLPEVLHPVTAIAGISRPFGAEWREYMLVAQQNGSVNLYSLANLHKHSFTVQRNSLAPEKRYNCHNDAISRLLWCEAVQGFITSSWDSRLYITELETGKRLRTLASDGHEKSVFFCEYSPQQKLIASCGADKDVLLWNPHMDYSVMRLSGHLCSVQSVAFNFEDHQLITLAADQTVKLWDLRVPRVLQTILEKSNVQYAAPLSAVACDTVQQRVVVASNYPQGLVMRKSLSTHGTIYTGHNDPLVGVAYSPEFDLVVTVDTRKAVVWSCRTGKRMIAFYIGKDPATTLHFDGTNDRLVVGYQTGGVAMWNFVCGQPIKRGKLICQEEVLALCQMTRADRHRQQVLVGAYRRSLVFWSDSEGVADPVNKVLRLDIDISCIALCPPLIVAVGTSDGSIIFYNCNSFQSTFVLRRPGTAAGRQMEMVDLDEQFEELQSKQEDTHRVRQFAPCGRSADNTVEAMVFLATRQVLVSVMGDGYIQFWDVKTGQLLLLYGAKYFRSQAMFVLASDKGNRFLFAADDQGLLYVYDVAAIPGPGTASQPSAFIRPRLTRSCMQLKHFFRAYRASVLSIEYLDQWELILTSCGDSNAISLWTINGGPVGQFGQATLWDLTQLPPLKPLGDVVGQRELLRDPFTYRLLKPQPKRSGYALKGPLLADLGGSHSSKFDPSPSSPGDAPMHRILDGLKLPHVPTTTSRPSCVAPDRVTFGSLLQGTPAGPLPDLTGQHHLHRINAPSTASSHRPEVHLVSEHSSHPVTEDFTSLKVPAMELEGSMRKDNRSVAHSETSDTKRSEPPTEEALAEGAEAPADGAPEEGDPRRWFERIARRLLGYAPSRQPLILVSLGTGLAAIDSKSNSVPVDPLSILTDPPPPMAPMPDEEAADATEPLPAEAPPSPPHSPSHAASDPQPEAVPAEGDPTFITAADDIQLAIPSEVPDPPATSDPPADAPAARPPSVPQPKAKAGAREPKAPPPKIAQWAERASSLLPLQKLAPVPVPSKAWASSVDPNSTKPEYTTSFLEFHTD
eukprot:GGOE01003974.1.p1 GENE.GGOE01003974.1~~GGOE01003974.1.p1  ORF type:complete len:1248 (+),score=423.68 GGOE01003974.1:164-3907(+)